MSRTLREVQAEVERLRITDRELAEASNLSLGTVHHAIRGNTDAKNSTVEALSSGIDVVIAQREAAAANILNPSAAPAGGA